MTETLERFIVTAKASTYAAGGGELVYREGGLVYRDTYFGGGDFVGQEVVRLDDRPVWAMNYYGRILDRERITAATAGAIVQAGLSALYRDGRFLGGFEHEPTPGIRYVDTNRGDWTSFDGVEWIELEGARVYELLYHGGSIRES